ncbi:hypothetical protein SAMN04487910_4224 [Aquimarina amphilecti]|uniref:CHRD domain-containing protein n=1 Tax=Aquimarina amphilecti TaxID=1038014 RepID=A0A1H7VWQ6_AQUAM|nr:hypothetical protein [Aquimarina amphilecti]SEM13255.1 hypothetical protein SAMN04487910_4224 [Aquimarina amphilecti]
MKNLILLLFTVVLFCSSCNNDDDNQTTIKEFTIEESNNSGISGSIFFTKSAASLSDDIFIISVQLTGAELEASYTANIYNNSLSNGGDIAFPLDNFYNLGNSNLMVSSTTHHSSNQIIIEDEVLNYQELIGFDGHIKIFNEDDPSIVVAEGNIGSNAP